MIIEISLLINKFCFMKKIFTFCVAALAAMTMSAQQTMTCSAAADAALALPATDGKGTLDDTNSIDVVLTGYVTNTNGTVSRGQQTFYMDDVQGSAKTIQSYWGNLPEDDQTPLNVGDQISLAGRIFNYNGTVAEIKNGTVTIIQRVTIVRDTTEVSICDAIEIGESQNADEVSDDYYIVKGVVTAANAYNTNYNNQTFDFKCEDNNKVLEAYNVSVADTVSVGDTVKVLGRLTNFRGTKIEFNGGNATILYKAVVNTVTCDVKWATATGMELDRGAQSQSKYVITGYVDSIVTAYSEQYDNITFFMCDDMANPTYEFEAFRVKGGADLHVGDKVVVTGYIQHYYKAATEEEAEVELIETVAGATYELLSADALENIFSDEAAEKFIIDGQLYIRKDGVVYTVLGAKK